MQARQANLSAIQKFLCDLQHSEHHMDGTQSEQQSLEK